MQMEEEMFWCVIMMCIFYLFLLTEGMQQLKAVKDLQF